MEGLIFLGIFLGCFARTLLPYLKKLKQAAGAGKAIKFDSRYLVSPMVTMIIAAIAAMLLMPGFDITDEASFFVAFSFGWNATDIVNTMIS